MTDVSTKILAAANSAKPDRNTGKMTWGYKVQSSQNPEGKWVNHESETKVANRGDEVKLVGVTTNKGSTYVKSIKVTKAAPVWNGGGKGGFQKKAFTPRDDTAITVGMAIKLAHEELLLVNKGKELISLAQLKARTLDIVTIAEECTAAVKAKTAPKPAELPEEAANDSTPEEPVSDDVAF